MFESAGLLNMSSFGKLVLHGKDSRRAIDWLCSNDVGGEGEVCIPAQSQDLELCCSIALLDSFGTDVSVTTASFDAAAASD